MVVILYFLLIIISLGDVSSINQLAHSETNITNQENDKQPQPQPQQTPLNQSETMVGSPRSDRLRVLEMFNKFFTKARSHDDKRQKEFVRDGVINRLKELGFETSFLQKSRFDFRHETAYSFNMISILPGKSRKTKDEQIVLVGAHWDSATKAPVSYNYYSSRRSSGRIIN